MFSVIKEIIKPQLGILQRVQEASLSVHAVKKLMTDPTLLSVLMGDRKCQTHDRMHDKAHSQSCHRTYDQAGDPMV